MIGFGALNTRTIRSTKRGKRASVERSIRSIRSIRGEVGRRMAPVAVVGQGCDIIDLPLAVQTPLEVIHKPLGRAPLFEAAGPALHDGGDMLLLLPLGYPALN